MPLPETRRQQLDSIVKQMLANKESDKNIQAVVNDFVTKYQNETQITQPKPNLGTNSIMDTASSLFNNTAKFVGGAAGNLTNVAIANSSAAKGLSESDAALTEIDNKAIQKAHELALKGDKVGADRLLNVVRSHGKNITVNDLLLNTQQNNLKQIAGAGLGTAMEVGTFAKVNPTKIAEPITKKTLGQTLKNIGTNTTKRAIAGATAGYGYDVAQNLQSEKTGSDILKPGMGTLIGGVVPTIIGGVQAGVAITKDIAPRFINSLIKPSKANFSYGKDPGRTVSELGITGNSLPDFGRNINNAKQEIGSEIGSIYSSPENANLRIDVSPEISKIDKAIQDAAKGGKQNQAIVTALQNTKDALLYEHAVNADGMIEKVGTVPRDLTNLSPQEAFDLKQLISGQTKFTGNPSDDKTVNSVLKNIYGDIKEKLNNAVGKNNPEILDLNQKYADLTSAELAVQNRDMIVKRSAMISMPVKVGTATALISSIVSGGASIPVLLAGATAGVLDKALESTAVKTRIASWLGSAEPSVINKLVQQNPGLKTIFYRLVPNLGSRIGK